MEQKRSTPLYISERELSERWDIPVKTFQRWRTQGGGPPFVKFGGSVRYAIEDIEKYEQLNRFYSTSEQSPQSDDNLDNR